MDTIAFWAICAIAIIAAAFASWRVITKARYTKVVAKNNSIASGNNTIINHKDDESPQGEG